MAPSQSSEKAFELRSPEQGTGLDQECPLREDLQPELTSKEGGWVEAHWRGPDTRISGMMLSKASMEVSCCNGPSGFSSVVTCFL